MQRRVIWIVSAQFPQLLSPGRLGGIRRDLNRVQFANLAGIEPGEMTLTTDVDRG